MRSKLLWVGIFACCAPGVAVAQEQIRTVNYDDCLAIIRKMAQDFRVTPENIVETPDARVVRFNTVDGGVIVACSRPDKKMVIKKSP